MAAPPLPAGYVERMSSLLGDEAAEFFASYERPARPGLRDAFDPKGSRG
jgi:hypothetical protein